MRPRLIEELLLALDDQRTNGEFSYSAVVVDNDASESARDAVERVAQQVGFQVDYHVEPQQNIALARNRAVRQARGEFIAMIDDDEVPGEEWLSVLFGALNAFRADGVLGPVRPRFADDAPGWLKRSGLCDRSSHPSGQVLSDTDTRTGNVLFDRRVFNEGKNQFREQYGRTGGEDIEFFDERIRDGFKFVWCEEAPVYEYVLGERLTTAFYLKKNVRIGGLTGEKMRKGTVPLIENVIKSLGHVVLYIPVMPLLALGGKHVLMRHVCKYVYHVSRLLGVGGLVAIRERW